MRPRLGFLGTGWIGRHRMQAIAEADVAEIVAFADPVEEMALAAQQAAPHAHRVAGMEELLALGLDGIVIATPSAQHAAQSVQALRQGVAVFCQKPLGRDAAEVRGVVQAAQQADRLLGLDLSYRATDAMQRIRALVQGGELGRVQAVDLVFHNAYGPDKPWFKDKAQSGGGCVMDLGVHLVDLALWALDFPEVAEVSAQLFAKGAPLPRDAAEVEDFALATLVLADRTVVRLACSWWLHAGRDAVISAAFHGTQGGAALHNVDGSFYDFSAERFRGTAREVLATPPDAWGGRMAVQWAWQLAQQNRFDSTALRFIDTAAALDRIYGR
ncbi:Gfo/Idh/MocA family oxidoreductase [Roseomonas frigidaquae]|uniref:Gfo/Idh/MocA family oxidoreductase n=1 Tax=Falsiroseomonas frigidaquae TaxID=487318 RepID=A0ABX1EZE7_9PROT|nr:Gfo/Idh/MocA family oxidoreductase [Falsiroseomonas frigidaquae]NKE45456.1 Gfo/Idh/MocA family oxidoreductase [Falsiroseomonas frigidaquae]